MKKYKKKYKLFIQYLYKIWSWSWYMINNALENVNLKLKKLVGSGFLSEKNAYRKVKEFHEDQIALYTQCVVRIQMNKSQIQVP